MTIPEAIRGATIEVPTLNGSKRIRVAPGTQHGTVQRLRGEGPPKLGNRGRGDIHYRLTVDVPKSLSDEQREVVDELAAVMDQDPRAGIFGKEDDVLMAGERERGVYMISVAAELAGMHPQTLRIYEARGLIQPKRSPKNTRLYSDEDVQRLRRIQQLTSELGMNLAGVERVFELEQEVARMRRRLNNIERAAERAQEELRAGDRARAPGRQGRAGALRAARPGAGPARAARVRIRVRRTPLNARLRTPCRGDALRAPSNEPEALHGWTRRSTRFATPSCTAHWRSRVPGRPTPASAASCCWSCATPRGSAPPATPVTAARWSASSARWTWWPAATASAAAA